MMVIVRRSALWLLTLPLAVGGSQIAHAQAYRIVYADPHDRAHALASSGHAYLEHAPLAVALGLAFVGVALVARARGAGGRLATWPFAAVPVATFLLQEVLERGGDFSAVPEPTTLVGLVLQLPFALLAYTAALLLLRVVDALVLGGGTRRALGGTAALRVPIDLHLTPLPALAVGHAQRGPPRSG